MHSYEIQVLNRDKNFKKKYGTSIKTKHVKTILLKTCIFVCVYL